MEGMAKATVTKGDTVVTFEGPQEFVDAQVGKYMALGNSSDIRVHSGSTMQGPGLTVNTAAIERQLVLAKKPKGHSEIIAVLAFALAESGTTEFTEENIRKAYIRAGVRPPKVVGQAIRDAKNNFDFVETGRKRGTYKLTNHGDRFVRFDLPRATNGKE